MEKYNYENYERLDELEKRLYEEKAKGVKKLLSNPLLSSLYVRVDEKELNNIELREVFKDFEWTDERKFKNFNPFKEPDEDGEMANDLVRLTFFKNHEGTYRVIYSNSNSLLYRSNVKKFMEGLDVKLSVADKINSTNLKDWNADQMEQQKLALYYGVDISRLDPSKWDADQMEQQRMALENGVDISSLDPSKWDWQQMEQQRLALYNGNDISRLDPDKWDAKQMRQQRWALENGVDLSSLDPSKWDCLQMQEQRLALIDGVDISDLDPAKWDWEQMRQQRVALYYGVDISSLDPSKWDADQMRQQREKLVKNKEEMPQLEPKKIEREKIAEEKSKEADREK